MHLQIDALGAITITVPSWPQFRFEGLRPSLRIDGDDATWTDIHTSSDSSPTGSGDATLITGYAAQGIRLELLLQVTQGSLLVRGTIHNDDTEAHDLDGVVYLGTATAGAGTETGSPAVVSFASDASHVRILEQGNYWGHVRRLGESPDTSATNTGEHDSSQTRVQGSSDHVAVVHDAQTGMALPAGFQTSERWLGRIQLSTNSSGEVDEWRLGFDGGGVRLAPGSSTTLEEALMLTGDDPWALLEAYGDRVAARHGTVESRRPAVVGPQPVTDAPSGDVVQLVSLPLEHVGRPGPGNGADRCTAPGSPGPVDPRRGSGLAIRQSAQCLRGERTLRPRLALAR